MHRSTSSLCILLGLTMTGSALAQSGSFLQNIPSGFVFADAGSAGGSEILKNSPYTGVLQPPTVSANPNVPVFDIVAMFPAHWETVKIDAMSTGNDLCPIDNMGVITPPNGMWVSLNFSVKHGAFGRPGGVVNNFAQGPSGSQVGACVFAHHFEQSELPESVEGQTFLEHQPGALVGIPGNGQADLIAYDTFVELIVNAEEGNQMFPNVSEFYFSLTPSSAAALNTHSTAFIQNMDVHESSIYKIVWSGGSTPGWGPPQLVHDYRDLNLPVLNPVAAGNGHPEIYANVDAIGVNTDINPTKPGLFFSVERDPGLPANYAQVWYMPPFLSPVPVLDPNSVRLDVVMALAQDDEVDAICFNDPDFLVRPIGIGMPMKEPSLTEPERLGISVAQMRKGSGQDLIASVVGLDRFGPLGGRLQFWAFTPGLPHLLTGTVRVVDLSKPFRVGHFVPLPVNNQVSELRIYAKYFPRAHPNTVVRSFVVAVKI